LGEERLQASRGFGEPISKGVTESARRWKYDVSQRDVTLVQLAQSLVQDPSGFDHIVIEAQHRCPVCGHGADVVVEYERGMRGVVTFHHSGSPRWSRCLKRNP